MSTVQVQKLEIMVSALTRELEVAAASRDRMKYELKNSTTERDRLKAELEKAQVACAAMCSTLENIRTSDRWSASVTTGLLGLERDGPWVCIDHKRIDDALSTDWIKKCAVRDAALAAARVEIEKCEEECRAHTEAGRLFAQSALRQIDAVLPKEGK